MARLFLLLILFCASPLGDVLTLGVAPQVCSQACPDDDEHGACAPDCQDCTCCAHVSPTVLAPPPVLAAWPEVERERVEVDVVALVSADADDILHVPKPLLA